MTHRHQVRLTRDVLRLQQRHRVRTIRRRRPPRMARQRHPLPRVLTPSSSVIDTRMLHDPAHDVPPLLLNTTVCSLPLDEKVRAATDAHAGGIGTAGHISVTRSV